MKHRYLAEQGKHEWSNILSKISDISPTFHMDFSENLCGMSKFEPQTAHFLKWQFSLYSTVKHDCNTSTDKLSYSHYCHLYDDFTCDAVFTSTAFRYLISQIDVNETKNLRLKSNNCSCQCKSKYVSILIVFSKWEQ